MSVQNKLAPGAAVKEAVFTRIIQAPRALVFKAWTEQKHVAAWWGPRGFTNPACDWNPKPGNKLRIDMRGPAGTPFDIIMPMKGYFHEVIADERLVLTATAIEDAKGIPQLESLNTVTFADHNNHETELTVNVAVFKATPGITDGALQGMEEGWMQTLDRLENYLSVMKRSVFLLTRSFRAPRPLMWKMWTEPQHMAQWWGPKGTKSQARRMDFRPGGTYHYSMQTPNDGAMGGKEMWGKMGYKEITPPSKLVFTNSFSDANEGLTRHPMVPNWPLELETTITLTAANDWTIVKIQWIPVNASDSERKAFEDMQESCHQGWGGSLDQLTEYLQQGNF